jgi:hypothetical protein
VDLTRHENAVHGEFILEAQAFRGAGAALPGLCAAKATGERVGMSARCCLLRRAVAPTPRHAKKRSTVNLLAELR